MRPGMFSYGRYAGPALASVCLHERRVGAVNWKNVLARFRLKWLGPRNSREDEMTKRSGQIGSLVEVIARVAYSKCIGEFQEF